MRKSKLCSIFLVALSVSTIICTPIASAKSSAIVEIKSSMTAEQYEAYTAEINSPLQAKKDKDFKNLLNAVSAKSKSSSLNKGNLLTQDKKATITNKEIVNSKYDITGAITTSSLPSGYPTRYGVILTTSDASTVGLAHGHNGIIWTSTHTVEAKLSTGVQLFTNDWTSRYSNVLATSVSGTTAAQDDAASNWCAGKIGSGYLLNFLNTGNRSKFYCSHLIWAAYKDLYSINLDDDGGIIIPYDIPLSSKSYAFWGWQA